MKIVDSFVACAAAVVRERSELLTDLDRAIGDGDHGINMKRGFDAVEQLSAELVSLPPGAALQKIGTTLVMTVGGASGPLYGSFFMTLGHALPESPRAGDLATAVAAGVDAVRKRGRSEVGEKTLLDVLVPVADALRTAVAEGAATDALRERVVAAARSGLEATRPLQATKGRASFLKERSVGHLDPGAMSSYLLIEAACRSFEEFP